MSTQSSSLPNQPRYWCHSCNAEVQVYMAPDPTCQQCKDQFIEEIESSDDPRRFLAGINDNHNDNGLEGRSGFGRTGFPRYDSSTEGNIIFSFLQQTSNANHAESGGTGTPMFSPEIQNIIREVTTNISNPFRPFTFISSTGSAVPQAQQTQNQGGQDQRSQDQNSQNQSSHEQRSHDYNEPNAMNTSTTNPLDQQQQQQNQWQSFYFYGGPIDFSARFRQGQMPGEYNSDNSGYEQPFVTWITRQQPSGNQNEEPQEQNTHRPDMTGLLRFITTITALPAQAGFIGNPNDYVFSQAALDNIITQLMDQAGSNAPPPAPREVVDSLHKRPLTKDELDRQLDCAVCKDEFYQDELVTDLPCSHVYHEDCIKQWLKVNGTCPVCRQSVASDKQKTNERSTEANPHNQSAQPPQEPPADASTNTQTSSFPYPWSTSNNRAQSTLPSSWPSHLPGAFTWSPGGLSTHLSSTTLGTATSASNQSNDTQSSSSANDTPNNNTCDNASNDNQITHMDIDLD